MMYKNLSELIPFSLCQHYYRTNIHSSLKELVSFCMCRTHRHSPVLLRMNGYLYNNNVDIRRLLLYTCEPNET